MREIRISRDQKRTLQLLTLRRVVRGASMCEPYRLISRWANEQNHSDAPYATAHRAICGRIVRRVRLLFTLERGCRRSVDPGRCSLPSSLRPRRPHADPLGARLRKLPLHLVGRVGRHQRGDLSI